ncbi:MAG: phosphopantetheine-binding protein [Aeromicrobium sp.]
MPTPDDVLAQIADILIALHGTDPDAVQPATKLKDLGVDSITIVELGEELGRRFDLYLSDDAIDGMATVKDAISAVVRNDGTGHITSSPPVPAKLTIAPVRTTPEPAPERERTLPRDRDPVDPVRVKSASRFAVWMAIAGAAIGVLIGLGSAAVIGATGLGAADLPPLSIETTPAPTASETTTAAPEPTGTAPTEEPTIQVSNSRVSPGERFTLEGAFPALGSGATLQVQVKDPGGDWDSFPVDTKTKGGGTYKTEIYTSRTGKRDFRLFHEESNKASPAVTVEIG